MSPFLFVNDIRAAEDEGRRRMGARNAMEIFSLLDKSNCRICGEKTCLAFAGAVYTGRRRVEECPLLRDRSVSGITDSPAGER